MPYPRSVGFELEDDLGGQTLIVDHGGVEQAAAVGDADEGSDSDLRVVLSKAPNKYGERVRETISSGYQSSCMIK